MALKWQFKLEQRRAVITVYVVKSIPAVISVGQPTCKTLHMEDYVYVQIPYMVCSVEILKLSHKIHKM